MAVVLCSLVDVVVTGVVERLLESAVTSVCKECRLSGFVYRILAMANERFCQVCSASPAGHDNGVSILAKSDFWIYRQRVVLHTQIQEVAMKHVKKERPANVEYAETNLPYLKHEQSIDGAGKH